MNNLAMEAPSHALRDSYLKLALQWEALAERAERGVKAEDRPMDSTGSPED
jgi:hypothetical protein